VSVERVVQMVAVLLRFVGERGMIRNERSENEEGEKRDNYNVPPPKASLGSRTISSIA